MRINNIWRKRQTLLTAAESNAYNPGCVKRPEVLKRYGMMKQCFVYLHSVTCWLR
jgi:hypothetical protein